jgi:hypothetical protein
MRVFSEGFSFAVSLMGFGLHFGYAGMRFILA